MEVQRVPVEQFDAHLQPSLELSSESLGASILDVSDEWFGPARSLLRVDPPELLAGQFGPRGALYDGWESRRHNPAYDWVIVRLGVRSGQLIGFDVDTTHFNGNESPACAVYGLDRLEPPPASVDDPDWVEILPVAPLGPSSRHLFKIPPTEQGFQYVKLHMIPDGGIARFRVYGHPIPTFPDDPFDLASVLLGAQVVFTSDQHYGAGSNLILPGRGPPNMGGGWETKRSRQPGHSDHVIIKLAHKGYLDYVEVDTNYFIGNFPQTFDLCATRSPEVTPGKSAEWTEILCKTKLGPHQQQFFHLSQAEHAFTHVRMTIYPDGGVKRIRLFGRRFPHGEQFTLPSTSTILKTNSFEPSLTKSSAHVIPILPLTNSAFAPYGSVIQADSDPRAHPPALSTKSVNFGTALKLDKIAKIECLDARSKVPSLSLFSCQPWSPVRCASQHHCWTLKGVERHQFSSQTFIPLMVHSTDASQKDGEEGNDALYLIVVTLDDGKGKPQTKNLKAFMGKKSQGISYLANIWHSPLIAVKGRMDFASLIYETGETVKDCELIEFTSGEQIVCELDNTIKGLIGF